MTAVDLHRTAAKANFWRNFSRGRNFRALGHFFARSGSPSASL